MSYGFNKTDSGAVGTGTVKLPPVQRTEKPAADISRVLQAGQDLGFVSRDAGTRRKPGPKRKEPQDRLTVTGPKRIIDRLKAYCDANGGASYCEAIEALLDGTEK
ncbi:hypothetical protein ACQQ2Q_22370 [Agrobacterium sp. ES01]|uniref:hypothetical protein n=1 Tax=Agrobacterium sp. ES01 TaxID=3420714 RepID=UPI003D0B7CD9